MEFPKFAVVETPESVMDNILQRINEVLAKDGLELVDAQEQVAPTALGAELIDRLSRYSFAPIIKPSEAVFHKEEISPGEFRHTFTFKEKSNTRNLNLTESKHEDAI